MPTMFSGLPRHSGSRVTGEAITALTRSSGFSSAFERDHVGAVDHHVGQRELAQIEHAAEHVAVELLDAALAVQQIDGAAQFLVRRQHRLILADDDADVLEQPAHQRLDRISIGPSTVTTSCIGRATLSAMRSGALNAAVFGSTSAKTTMTTVITTVA